jgi:hypothetical protein
MRYKIALSLSILVTAVILISCNGVEPVANINANKSTNTGIGPDTTYADGARRITTSELETLMKNGGVFLVDVRNQASYDIGHLPGSHLIPAEQIANHLNELPKDKLIVTYCS